MKCQLCMINLCVSVFFHLVEIHTLSKFLEIECHSTKFSLILSSLSKYLIFLYTRKKNTHSRYWTAYNCIVNKCNQMNVIHQQNKRKEQNKIYGYQTKSKMTAKSNCHMDRFLTLNKKKEIVKIF